MGPLYHEGTVSDHDILLRLGPMSEGHTLVIPKYHSASMDEVPDEYLAEILPLAKKIALSIGCTDYNILQVS